jgi:type VI secretion system ImpM family protein
VSTSGPQLSAPAVVGKVRSEREFLRSRSAGPLATFEAWLAENMAWAAASAGERWPAAFAGGALHAFVFRVRLTDETDAVLAGAIAPSSDELGRPYPVAVVAELESSAPLASSPELLPVLLEQFWDQSAELVFDAAAHGSDPTARLPLIASALPDPGNARAAYDAWLHECKVTELAALCAESSAHFLESLAVLIDAVRPHAGCERPLTPLTFHLPLGHGGGASVCFWLDVLRRSMGWTHTIPSFFWSADHERASLLLHLGTPPRQTLTELWGPREIRDAFCDLVTPHAVDTHALSLPEPVAATLAAPDATLQQLLGVLRG